jgi:hypothetical protein
MNLKYEEKSGGGWIQKREPKNRRRISLCMESRKRERKTLIRKRCRVSGVGFQVWNRFWVSGVGFQVRKKENRDEALPHPDLQKDFGLIRMFGLNLKPDTRYPTPFTW